MFKLIDSKWIEFRLWLKIASIIVSIIISSLLFFPFENHLDHFLQNSSPLSFFIDIVPPLFFIGLCLIIIILVIQLTFWLLGKRKY